MTIYSGFIGWREPQEAPALARPRTLALSPGQRLELVRLRDHSPRPHLREKAAALLKVADGAVLKHVARLGLLRPRDEGTVAAWLDRYLAEGISGLGVRPGRGRKPAFSPGAPQRRSGRRTSP